MRASFLPVALLTAVLTASVPARAQQWNDPRTMALVDRAISRRAAQLADTGLADFRANAHGYVTFLAQVGDGFPDPPKVVRTDELAVEVYWRAPNQSKQVIVGRRDTLLLPTDIAYHRDHLAIVQNNFPNIIRLGDGDEVRDVPHPLSNFGRNEYDFAVADSLTIRTTDRVFEVLMVKIRPKNDLLPRAVGAIYLDRATGSVVRMTFSFTRVALKDPQLEDVSVILENGLVDGRFWVPRRQEIEIRRSGSWMDFPARGIIRGRWEITGVETNIDTPPAFFVGPEIITVSPEQLKKYAFKGDILAGLPSDVKLAENDDVRQVQEDARALVRAEALSRTRLTTPSARSVSDIIRVNRNEGLAVGAGISHRFGDGFSALGRARFGTADHAFKGTVGLGWQRSDGAGWSIRAYDDYREAGDQPEVSGVRNTIASQEFGSDFTDYYRTCGAAVTADFGLWDGTRWRLTVGREDQRPLAVTARPSTGNYAPALPADPLSAWRIEAEGFRAAHDGPFGATVQGSVSVLASRVRRTAGVEHNQDSWFGRLALSGSMERPFGADRLVLSGFAAIVTGANAPVQSLVYLGGPISAPGFDFHQRRAAAALTQRVEWRHPVASIPVSIGRFGRLSMPVSLVPFGQLIWTDSGVRSRGPAGWNGALGVGVITIFDLLRIDVARGIRGGRWTFGVDVTHDLWRIL
jgi:hypothetical protein